MSANTANAPHHGDPGQRGSGQRGSGQRGSGQSGAPTPQGNLLGLVAVARAFPILWTAGVLFLGPALTVWYMTGARIERVEARLSDRIDQLEERMDRRFERLEVRLDKNFGYMDFGYMDQRFERIGEQLDALLRHK